LRDHAAVRLEVVGPLRLDSSLFPAGQLLRTPFVPYEELPRLLASSWINLAPLAPTRFNECKSAIKFLEASAFACPTLASPNDDLLRHQEQGAPVVPCRAERDWYEQLGSLLDAERRMNAGRAAAEYVAARGMAASQVSAWLRALEDREVR
jgi:glycosyltransferase involved in cell wall biosynthesis